jgi:succinate dehydrogenase/fumarate reductase flavoprotein subunit
MVPSRGSERFFANRRAFLKGAASLPLAFPASSLATGSWHEESDVVVVGGGASGCVAAATALAGGAKVCLSEKAGFLGGTSAKSGGGYWIPNNFTMRERGIADPKPEFLQYVARYSYPASYNAVHSTLGLPEMTYRLLEAFYDHADDMVQRMVSLGALRSRSYTDTDAGTSYPDYLEDAPENRAPRGRLLVPMRPDGSIGAGDELMKQLTDHVRRAGARILVDTPVVDLVQQTDRTVTGVIVQTETGRRAIRARRGVVFCTGGYAHNQDLIRSYQADPIFGRCALPTCTGDFTQLGVRGGARLGNMGGAWRAQCVLEEALQYASLPMEVWFPIGDSMFVVNKYGRRCYNENRNYHDRARACYRFDASRAEYPDLLTFPVYDQRTAERFAGNYPLPREPLGEAYIISGETLDSLAAALDERLKSLSARTGGVRLDASFVSTLRETRARFNRFATEGRDPDFQRGDHAFDLEAFREEQAQRTDTRWPSNPYPSPVMHPLADHGPYFTMILAPAILDTNGGPMINPDGAVLGTTGRALGGLFGAGNCIASPAANTYWGGGATLGLGMTFGYLAGRSAAARHAA